uniref:hypothetical protein n=1 Tax=Polynucleobacter sp. TaxID=2029855 RepID=UPI004048822F
MNTELIEVNKDDMGTLESTRSLLSQAEDLAREHEEFNDRYIVAGRKALYELLGKIYALAEELDRCIDREDQVSLLKKVLLEKYGIRSQENTSDTTVLVRYITQADRKTAHVYSRAIEAARINRVDSSSFAGFIEQAGGIERIRSDNAAPAQTNKEVEAIEAESELRFELARKYLTARTELPLASFKLGKRYLRSSKSNSFKQFICYERGGRYYVLEEQLVDRTQELKIISELSEKFGDDIVNITKNVNAFHAKAMLKRKKRTIKEISKKRPEIAASIKIHQYQLGN